MSVMSAYSKFVDSVAPVEDTLVKALEYRPDIPNPHLIIRSKDNWNWSGMEFSDPENYITYASAEFTIHVHQSNQAN